MNIFFCCVVALQSSRELFRIYGGGEKLHSSTHGMDPHNPEMHATLVLHGPSIAPLQRVRKVYLEDKTTF